MGTTCSARGSKKMCFAFGFLKFQTCSLPVALLKEAKLSSSTNSKVVGLSCYFKTQLSKVKIQT